MRRKVQSCMLKWLYLFSYFIDCYIYKLCVQPMYIYTAFFASGFITQLSPYACFLLFLVMCSFFVHFNIFFLHDTWGTGALACDVIPVATGSRGRGFDRGLAHYERKRGAQMRRERNRPEPRRSVRLIQMDTAPDWGGARRPGPRR